MCPGRDPGFFVIWGGQILVNNRLGSASWQPYKVNLPFPKKSNTAALNYVIYK